MPPTAAPPEVTAAPDRRRAGHVEFGFERGDFERVRSLIHARAGISLQSGKQAMVYGRLSRRLRETGHGSFGAYLRWLASARGAQGEQEWQAFVNCLTTNLTAFFREAHHFDALAQALRTRAGTPLRIWCAAASTGEEPYSIAMTVAESLGAHADVSVLATDIDTRALATAARAEYPADARGLGAQRRRAHCLRGVAERAGLLRIKPGLAHTVELARHNLVEPRWSLGAPFDIVFCRNVMIYFDAATQRSVLGRLHAAMKPQGLLFVGHAEHVGDARDLFRLRGKTIYERV